MKNILFITVLLFSLNSFSQQQTRDVVYLKNGSIVKGTITEMNPSKDLKIETADGSLFVYEMSDIVKMEKEDFIGIEMNQNKTSDVVSQTEIDNYFSGFLKNKRPALKFVGVSKKNGIKREIFGQNIYEIEYELIMDVKEDIYVSTSQFQSAFSNSFNKDFSYTKSQTSGYEAALNGSKEKLSNGQRIVANGTINFEETDNGWRATGYTNKNFKTVSTNYLTADMAKKNKETTEQLKKEGDWKKTDITELNLTPVYFNAINVPFFNKSTNKLSIKKLPKKCTDCRNDNIMEIEETIKKSFIKTKRYSSITEDEYKNSSNKVKFNIYVSQISFTHKGVDEKGNDKGFSCLIKYGTSVKANYLEPQQLEFKDTKLDSAKSRSTKYFSNKEAAFKGALIALQAQISGIIYKYEPISLEVDSIELDKKGNPEYIILEETSNFSNRRKIEFYILEKSALSIKDGKYNVSNFIGQATYNKSTFPNTIKMKVKKSKMKKALKSYIGIETELIGFSK